MKYALSVAFVLALAGACTTPAIGTKHLPYTNPIPEAVPYIGYHEQKHRKELKDLVGVDPVYTQWCAAFVNAVLYESNIENNEAHAYPLTARSFLDWGFEVKSPIPGDIVVFPRGRQAWQGHVGFYLKTVIINDQEYYLILGGNQNNEVSIKTYLADRAISIRRQSEAKFI